MQLEAKAEEIAASVVEGVHCITKWDNLQDEVDSIIYGGVFNTGYMVDKTMGFMDKITA